MPVWISSWFGTGFLPVKLFGTEHGGGTVATIATVPLILVLSWAGWLVQLLAAILVASLSVYAGQKLPASQHDPPWLVIDEAAGALVASIGLGFGNWHEGGALLLSLFIFRLVDIFKPAWLWIREMESWPGGWGITADDVLAGCYGLAVGSLFLIF